MTLSSLSSNVVGVVSGKGTKPKRRFVPTGAGAGTSKPQGASKKRRVDTDPADAAGGGKSQSVMIARGVSLEKARRIDPHPHTTCGVEHIIQMLNNGPFLRPDEHFAIGEPGLVGLIYANAKEFAKIAPNNRLYEHNQAKTAFNRYNSLSKVVLLDKTSAVLVVANTDAIRYVYQDGDQSKHATRMGLLLEPTFMEWMSVDDDVAEYLEKYPTLKKRNIGFYGFDSLKLKAAATKKAKKAALDKLGLTE